MKNQTRRRATNKICLINQTTTKKLKMKKILPMILLLSFSLPALSQTVLLKCNYTDSDGTKGSRAMGFDEVAGTVIEDDITYPINTKTMSGWKQSADKSKYWTIFFISKSAFGYTRYANDEIYTSASISRMDGEYTQSSRHGICVPFKQAF